MSSLLSVLLLSKPVSNPSLPSPAGIILRGVFLDAGMDYTIPVPSPILPALLVEAEAKNLTVEDLIVEILIARYTKPDPRNN